jgi:hypothetical protein
LRGIAFDVVWAVTPNGCTTIADGQSTADREKNWKEWGDYATTPIDGDPYGQLIRRLDAFWKTITFGGIKFSGQSDEPVADAFAAWWNSGLLRKKGPIDT